MRCLERRQHTPTLSPITIEVGHLPRLPPLLNFDIKTDGIHAAQIEISTVPHHLLNGHPQNHWLISWGFRGWGKRNMESL